MATVIITIEDELEERVAVALKSVDGTIDPHNEDENTNAQNLALEVLDFVVKGAETIHSVEVDGNKRPLQNPKMN